MKPYWSYKMPQEPGWYWMCDWEGKEISAGQVYESWLGVGRRLRAHPTHDCLWWSVRIQQPIEGVDRDDIQTYYRRCRPPYPTKIELEVEKLLKFNT